MSSTSDAYRPNAALIQGKDGALYGTTSNGGTHDNGAIFKIALDGQYQVLYSFGSNPDDGTVPTAALVQGSDGNFYGTTVTGGSNHCINYPGSGGNCGTVFKVTPQGVESLVYSFGASPNDGANPSGSLIQASDGNFYGTTLSGGSGTCGVSISVPHSCGTVFRMTPGGIVTVLHSFGGRGDGISPQGSLIQGQDGALYGTTPSGGTNTDVSAAGTVFKITLDGNEAVLHSFGPALLGGVGPSPFITQGSDGTFYGTTRSGGAYQCTSCGTVFRLTPAGAYTVLASFGPGDDSPSDPGAGVTQGRDGALYGVVFSGVPGISGGGAVFRLAIQ